MQKKSIFDSINHSNKQSIVNEIFASIANKYDVMNDVMSFGMHHMWKSKLCSMIPNLNSSILDVATGSGDILVRLKEKSIKYNAKTNLVGSDINSDMLNLCKNRLYDNNLFDNVKLIEANAEKLPFSDNSFDYYTIAFGIRNVTNIDKVLKEAFRVIKPFGKFLCLEFSKVDNKILEQFYNFYSTNIIPNIGKFVAKNSTSYQYLVESIKLFPNQDEFRSMIFDSGFKKVEYSNLTNGIVAIHQGYKL